MMRAVLYLHTATREQQDPDGLDQQRAQSDGHLRRRGWKHAGEYVDIAASGLTTQRPGLQALLDRLRTDPVDAVAVTRYDRLARDPHTLYATLTAIRDTGARLVTTAESLSGGVTLPASARLVDAPDVIPPPAARDGQTGRRSSSCAV